MKFLFAFSDFATLYSVNSPHVKSVCSHNVSLYNDRTQRPLPPTTNHSSFDIIQCDNTQCVARSVPATASNVDIAKKTLHNWILPGSIGIGGDCPNPVKHEAIQGSRAESPPTQQVNSRSKARNCSLRCIKAHEQTLAYQSIVEPLPRGPYVIHFGTSILRGSSAAQLRYLSPRIPAS